MHEILFSERPPYYPKPFKNLTIVVGEAIDFTEYLKELHKENRSSDEIQKLLTEKLQEAVEQLKLEAEVMKIVD